MPRILRTMGLACVQLFKIGEAAELFKEARGLLEQECGPCHQDTLGVYSNLAATYDAMGSKNVASQRWWVFYWQVSFSSGISLSTPRWVIFLKVSVPFQACFCQIAARFIRLELKGFVLWFYFVVGHLHLCGLVIGT